MLVLLLAMSALADQSSAPRALNPAEWIAIDDYPREAIDQKQSGKVGFTLQISDRGQVTGCQIVTTSGAASLDGATCALIFLRAHFSPAKDSNGKSIPGAFSSAVSWVYPLKIEEATSAKPIRLSGLMRDGELSSVLYVNGNGTITQCDAKQGEALNRLANPDICGLFRVGMQYSPPATFRGAPQKRKITIDMSVADVNVR